MGYWDIRIMLSNGRWVAGHSLNQECRKAGRCGCGFCKGEGQCDFGDCSHPLPSPTTHKVGTLCVTCSKDAWRWQMLAGHRPSVQLEPDQ